MDPRSTIWMDFLDHNRLWSYNVLHQDLRLFYPYLKKSLNSPKAGYRDSHQKKSEEEKSSIMGSKPPRYMNSFLGIHISIISRYIFEIESFKYMSSNLGVIWIQLRLWNCFGPMLSMKKKCVYYVLSTHPAFMKLILTFFTGGRLLRMSSR